MRHGPWLVAELDLPSQPPSPTRMIKSKCSGGNIHLGGISRVLEGWHPPLSPPPLFARIGGDRSGCRWGFSSLHTFWRCLQGESFPISRRNFIQVLHIDVCMCRITWLFSKPLISWVYWCTKVICRSLKRKYLSHPLCDWVSILTRLE